ncbi:MAG: flavodoxin domain-containing protein [Syntrophorhabdales bacterium]|jgi:flavorubredoxin
MARILVAYLSGMGTTGQMADYIAEGVRIAGHEPEVRPISEVATGHDLSGYDGYIFGCPTYHLDMPQAFESFLQSAEKAGLQGKVGGAFSPRSHPSSGGGGGAERVFSIMESKLGMRMTDLGPFDVETRVIGGPDGIRACQEYGKSVARMLG